MAADPLITTTQTPATPWNPETGIGSYPTLGAVPAQAEISDAVATPAAASTANAATRTLDNGELTSNNITGLINSDSPLMQQAAARAQQQANGRGLLNSSIAVGAAEGAVLDRATPIAQADAAARTNVLNTNQANQQQTNIFNAGQTQDVNKFNASTATQNAQFNAGEANKTSIVNASESNKVLSQLMDNQNKLYLADVEASYKTLMQSEASAMTIYQQSVKNISEILLNPDLTPAAKTAAVANQNQLLKTGLQVVGKIGSLNLDSLLTFPGTNSGPAGLTLTNDTTNNGKQLALLAGISTAADVTALSSLDLATQTSINNALQSGSKQNMISAIANTSLAQTTKDKLLGLLG